MRVNIESASEIQFLEKQVAEFLQRIKLPSTENDSDKSTIKASTNPGERTACLAIPCVEPGHSVAEVHFPPIHADEAMHLRIGCHTEQNDVSWYCEILYDQKMFGVEAAHRIARQFAHIYKQLEMHDRESQASINKLDLLDVDDERQLSDWNHDPPAAIDACFQDLFAVQVRSGPERPAISAWDGELTYRQLDELSNELAHTLTNKNIQPGGRIPLVFKKSKWMPVAMLAVAKVRATAVCICTSHPTDFIKRVIQQSDPAIILSAISQRAMLCEVVDASLIMIPEDLHNRASSSPSTTSPSTTGLPSASPDDVAFIVFSSGSTGTPKGIVLSHRAIATAGHYVGERLQINSLSRVLQFSSYAFDMSIIETWQALTRGACLCVPSETQRLNSMPEFMLQHRVTWAFFTPTTLKNYEPSDFPTLETVTVGGETVPVDLVRQWERSVSIFNLWGPAEVGPAGACPIEPTRGWIPGTFGKAAGCIAWVTLPDDTDSLAPIGTVGEVIIEGAVVADGYLNDQARTREVFIEPPGWRACYPDIPIQGRFFKTGDLCRYNEDGTLRYVTRRDTVVKIRGQRVDIDAVEVLLRQLEPHVDFIVCAVKFQDGAGAMTLVQFLVDPSGFEIDFGSQQPNADVKAPESGSWALSHRYQSLLRPHLPRYMVPSLVIPIKTFPRTATDKVDRRRLCQFFQQYPSWRLMELLGGSRSLCLPKAVSLPMTPIETVLVKAIASVCGISLSSIDLEASFLQLGGDSTTAIRLTRTLLAHDLRLHTESLLDVDCSLQVVAKKAKPINEKTISRGPRPFSLLESNDFNSLRHLASKECGIQENEIQDIYPTTPLQEGLFTVTQYHGNDAYVDRVIFSLPVDCNVKLAQEAWESVVEMTSILRTRIIQATNGCTYQVLVSAALKMPWRTASSELNFYEQDQALPVGLGSPLVRQTLIQDRETSGSPIKLAFTFHHSVYDAFTLHMCIKQAEKAYKKETLFPSSFADFVHHLEKQNHGDEEEGRQFWQNEMVDFYTNIFPALPSPDYVPCTTSSVVYEGRAITTSLNLTISATAKIRLAWAFLISLYTDSSDIVYGVVSDGRRGLSAELGSVLGPTIATHPVRINITREASVEESLLQVQESMRRVTFFEHTGLQNIQKMGDGPARACKFQNLLVIQADEMMADSPIFGPIDVRVGAANSFPGYAFILQVTCLATSLKFEMLVDEAVVSRDETQLMLCQLNHLLMQINDPQKQHLPLARLDLISDFDSAMLSTTEASMPVCLDSTIVDLVDAQVSRTSKKCAVSAWDGALSYADLQGKSDELAEKLQSFLADRNVQFIPILLERSKGVPISMLAVVKLGIAFVLLDPNQPEERNSKICDAVGATVGITSEKMHGLASRLSRGSWVVLSNPVEGHDDHAVSLGSPRTVRRERTPNPQSILYAAFTSGSTGEPKAVLIEHASYASAIVAQQSMLDITSNSRVLQLSSYAFDSFAVEILTVLASGGCVCIPSDAELTQGLGYAVQKYQANWACLTPSVLRLVTPDDVPSLRTVVAVGESMLPGQIKSWCNRVHLYCGYGPTECCTGAAVHRIITSDSDGRLIGKGMGALLWVVDKEDVTRRMPINTIGELIIQGPTVGRGYLNNPTKTNECFLKPSTWAPQFKNRQASRMYRTGDLVRRNLDGTFTFLGRTNQHTKLHGQRLDLAEVERHVLRSFGSDSSGIVTILRPADSDVPPCLVALVHLSASTTEEAIAGSGNRSTSEIFQPHSADFHRRASRVHREMLKNFPSVMAPELYLQLPVIPLTISGKINRRALLDLAHKLSSVDLHDLGALSHEENKSTDMLHQQDEPVAWALSEYIGELLQRKTGHTQMAADIIGRNIVISRVGLDSIDIMAVSQFVIRHFQHAISMNDLFDSALTIRAVADRITRRDNPELTSTKSATGWWEKVQCMISRINGMPACPSSRAMDPSRPPGKFVFLTGATGFLGTHILHQLLVDKRVSMVYVLVRARCRQRGLARIIQAARLARWWRDDYRRVIQAWPGDLSQPRLGLSDANWAAICGIESGIVPPCGAVDAIVHSGAVIHWGYDYETLEDANVRSTFDILQSLSERSTHVAFTYISALIPGDGAFASANVNDYTKKPSCATGCPPIELVDGYTQTKFASEQLIKAFSSRHSPHSLTVVRPGFMIGPVSNAVANGDDLLWRVVTTAMTTGSYNADESDNWIFVAAVDWVASLIIHETLYARPHQNVHTGEIPHGLPARVLSLGDGLRMQDFWQAIMFGLERDLTPSSSKKWMATVEQQVNEVGTTHPLWPLMGFLRASGGCIGVAPSEPLPVPKYQPPSLTNMIRQAVICNAEYLASLEDLATSTMLFKRRNKINSETGPNLL